MCVITQSVMLSARIHYLYIVTAGFTPPPSHLINRYARLDGPCQITLYYTTNKLDNPSGRGGGGGGMLKINK